MSARSKELLGLLPVSLLVTAGFTAVLVARTGANINKATLTYGAVFLGACLVGHVFIRARLLHRDLVRFAPFVIADAERKRELG